MEVEDFATTLERRLTERNEESPVHRKAAAVLASLMHATRTIPNFSTLYAGNTKAIALYIAGGTFKLLKRTIDGDLSLEHNLDAYLLILSQVLPETSPDALTQGGLTSQLRMIMLSILSRKDSSPFVTRLAASILSHALASSMTKTDFRKGQDRTMLLDLFQKAVAAPRSNALSRQCAKLLAHMLKSNSTVSAVLAEDTKAHLFSSLDEKKQLYLANVREVMLELPVRLLNDICHRVASTLADVDASDPREENYLAQTYFFLEKMLPKLLPSTGEDLLLTLIGAVPAGNQPERVQLSYLQLLYEAILALSQANERAANRLLSPVVSTLLQQLQLAPKVVKFAGNLLGFVLNNCVRPSLWRKEEDELSLETVNLDDTQDFTKLLCHLQSLLSPRFGNTRLTATILSQFFSKLESDAAPQCSELLNKIVEYRSQLNDKNFRKIMESVLIAFGADYLFSVYPPSLTGDISAPTFEEDNNLWILPVLQRSEAQEGMAVFYHYLLPLIQACKEQAIKQQSKQRREGYQLIEDLLWRTAKVFSRKIDTSANYQQVLTLIDNQLKSANESTQQQLARALEHLAEALGTLNYRSPAAEQLIKSIAGMLDLSHGNSHQMLLAIRGLARLAPKEYVKRVFDKNIQKLIGLAEAKTLQTDETKNLKNLEILMAVNGAIDLADPAVTTQFRLSREELLLRLVSHLLGSSSTFQKKGYKYLGEALAAAPQSLWLESLELLEGSVKVDGGAKYHRLAVLGRLWGWLRAGDREENLEKVVGFIKSHLPQVLLALRDHNRGARQEGSRILGEFSEVMNEMDLTQAFVESVCAGLVGERSQMKLATLAGLGVIIGMGHCSQQIFAEVLEIVLMLLREKRQELYRGVVEFCRRGVVGLPIDQQKIYLPSVLQQLFEEDEEGKLEHRSILRHFLIKLTKKHGREEIDHLIPVAHRKMLAHALKMENREKKKKRQQNIARRQFFQEQKKRQAEEQSSDSDDAEEPAQEHHVDPNAMEAEQPLEELDNANDLLLKYDLEKEQFHFERQQQRKAESEKKVEQQKDEITFDERGIMIIEERKRVRAQDEEQNEEETAEKPKDNLNFKKKPKTEVHQIKESGDTFKSSRAGGDVRLKDKPEPYAFIQFNSKALNKRFKKRAEHVFESLFEKKEGGLKGLKSRIAKGH